MTRFSHSCLAFVLLLLAWPVAPTSASTAVVAQQVEDLMHRSAAQDGPGLVVLIAKGDTMRSPLRAAVSAISA